MKIVNGVKGRYFSVTKTVEDETKGVTVEVEISCVSKFIEEVVDKSNDMEDRGVSLAINKILGYIDTLKVVLVPIEIDNDLLESKLTNWSDFSCDYQKTCCRVNVFYFHFLVTREQHVLRNDFIKKFIKEFNNAIANKAE